MHNCTPPVAKKGARVEYCGGTTDTEQRSGRTTGAENLDVSDFLVKHEVKNREDKLNKTEIAVVISYT